jgi:hypothetical protein
LFWLYFEKPSSLRHNSQVMDESRSKRKQFVKQQGEIREFSIALSNMLKGDTTKSHVINHWLEDQFANEQIDEFREKRGIYKELLLRTQIKISTWSEPEFSSSFVAAISYLESQSKDINRHFLLHKQSLLEEILSLLDEFNPLRPHERLVRLRQAETELFNHVDEFDFLLLGGIDCIPTEASIQSIYQDFLKTKAREYVRQFHRQALKTLFHKINRDLRSHIRSIIHFLFKNMDDEAEPKIVLIEKSNKTIFAHFFYQILWILNPLFTSFGIFLNQILGYRPNIKIGRSMPVYY